MPAYGYMDASRRGKLFGTGPKEVISRTVVGSEVIPFGRAVFGYAGNDKVCVLPQTDTNTLTLDGVLVTDNVITLTINGDVYAETFASTSDETLDALVAQLNSAGLIASRASLVITVTTKGETIVASGVVTLGAGQANVTAGTPAISGDLVFIGVAIAIQKTTNLPLTDDSYAVGEVASVLSLGDIEVETDGTAILSQTEAKILKTVVGVGKFTVASGTGEVIEGWYKESIPDSTTTFVVHLSGGITAIS